MSRFTGPKKKYQRRFGLLPENDKGPAHERKHPSKKTDYGVRLEHKQKLKFIYGLNEKEMRKYVQEATQAKTKDGTGDRAGEVMRRLELRLDNIVYRLGYGKSIAQARQLVNHGHVWIGGRRMGIPSYRVTVGEDIVLKEKTLENPHVKELIEKENVGGVPSWLKKSAVGGKIISLPKKEELPIHVDMNAVIELYA